MLRILKISLVIAAMLLTSHIVLSVVTYDPDRADTAASGQSTGNQSTGSGPASEEDAFDSNFNRFVSSGFGSLPLKVNDQMTLTRLTSSNRNITFYFTVDLGGAEVDKSSVKRQEPAMKAHFCSNPLFTALKRQDAKATIAVSDTRNRQVYRFFLDPKSC